MIAEVGGIVKVTGSRMDHPVGSPQPREHTDDGAQENADYGHEQVEGRDRDVKTE